MMKFRLDLLTFENIFIAVLNYYVFINQIYLHASKTIKYLTFQESAHTCYKN